MESLFNLMDKDGSGELSYEELIGCISRADSNDLKRQMMLLKLQIQDVWERLRGTFKDSVSAMEKNVEVLVRELLCENPPQKSGLGETKQSWNDHSFESTTDVNSLQQVYLEAKAEEKAASDHQLADSWKLLHAEAKQQEAKAAWTCPPESESHLLQLQRLEQLQSELQTVTGNLAAQAESLVENFRHSSDRLVLKLPDSLRPPLGDGKEALSHLEELEEVGRRWNEQTNAADELQGDAECIGCPRNVSELFKFSQGREKEPPTG